MKDDGLSVLRSADEMSALAPEWNALLARSPRHRFSQSHAWISTGWRQVSQPRGRELHCLVLREAGALVGVWPLVVATDGSRRVVRPAGAEASEYCGPLLAPVGDAMARTRRLWRAAARLGDLVFLPYVREDTALSQLLPRTGLWRTTDFPAPAVYAARADYADWAAYQKTLSGSLRHTIRRVRRRLGEKGKFTLDIEPRERRAELIDWMLEHKKRWLDDEGMESEWIGRRDYRDFLVDLAEQSDGTSGLLLFALRLDGAPVAANLVTIDADHFEVFIGVYDPAMNAFSPGQILTDHCLAWAFERGLDYDLRIGDAFYKRGWAPRTCNTHIWYVATGLRGLPFVLNRQRVVGSRQLKTRLARLKNRLKESWRKK